MMFNRLFLLCFLTLLIPTPLFAKANNFLTADREKAWASQRDSYRKALQYLSKGERERFRDEANTLKDYALYPDLIYREHSRYMGAVTQAQVDDFRKQYGDSVLATRLHSQWVQILADRKDWKSYLLEYQPGLYGAKYDCYYYWGQYQTGKYDEAFAGARKMWVVGKSQDSACDPLFGAWKAAGHIDSQVAWERMELAMAAGQTQLASHLESYLPASQKAAAKEWREVYRDPARLKDIGRYRALGDSAKPVIKSGFSRLVRRNADLALQLWPVYEKSFAFTLDEKAAILNDLAFVQGANYAPNADYWLTQALQYPQNKPLAPLAVRNALRKKDWPRVRTSLSLIEHIPGDDEEWRYWTARSNLKLPTLKTGQPTPGKQVLNQLGKQDAFFTALYDRNDFFSLLPPSVLEKQFTSPAPQDAFKKLADERHYYGFVSAERLGQPLNLQLVTTQVTEEQLREMARRPAVQRARELFLQDEIYPSRLEWHHTITKMNEADRGVAAYLAYIWGWNNQAILAAARSTAYDNLEIRFPVIHKDTVVRYARKYDVDPDWVYAVIRQESAFLPNARSPVGAMGMMQIMPATGRQLAREMRMPAPTPERLGTPEVNIQMGVYYLKQLQDQFNGNMILATASYNAGPHRAKAWQPKYGSMEGDIWVDTIPFRETRDYVKNILAYQAIYRHHLGYDVSLNQAMAAIPPRQATATAQR